MSEMKVKAIESRRRNENGQDGIAKEAAGCLIHFDHVSIEHHHKDWPDRLEDALSPPRNV